MQEVKHLEELKDLTQWVNFVLIWNPKKHAGKGGNDKPPINPKTLWNANTKNPDTWTDYNTAAANIGKAAKYSKSGEVYEATTAGAGLVLANGYCGVDFDDVIDEAGNVESWAAELLERLDTYTEKSPSGRGLHALLFCADLLEAGRNFGRQFTLARTGEPTDEDHKESELEVYFYTDGGRYLTVTGDTYIDKPINRTKGAELRAIFDEYSERADEYRRKKYEATAQAVGTHYATTGRAASDEDEKQMLDSALRAIDPGALDFGEWAAIMTALKVCGYSLGEAEDWTSGRLGGYINPKNDSNTNAKRWAKFNFKKGDTGAAGVIINAARRQGWTPAEAFDDEARTEYGRSLYDDEARAAYGRSKHTEEERREYGRQKHAERLEEWWNDHADGFREWQKQKKAGADQDDQQPKTTEKMTAEDFKKWMEGRAEK